MAKGLDSILDNYRTALAASPASLTALPETGDIEDLPAGALNKVFRVSLALGPRLRKIHGTTTVEYEVRLKIEVTFNPTTDSEEVFDTIGVSLEQIHHTMLKASNYNNSTTGIIHVGQEGDGFDDPVQGVNEDVVILCTGIFTVRYRITQDCT